MHHPLYTLSAFFGAGDILLISKCFTGDPHRAVKSKSIQKSLIETNIRESQQSRIRRVKHFKQPILRKCYLSFPRNWSHFDHFLGLQCIYDRAFPHIRISNQSNWNLLLINMQLPKLAEDVYQRSFSKWISDGSMKGQGGILAAQYGHPFLSNPGRHQVAFIQDENQVFKWLFLLKKLFYRGRSCAQGIPSVQYLQQDIWRIHNL